MTGSWFKRSLTLSNLRGLVWFFITLKQIFSENAAPLLAYYQIQLLFFQRVSWLTGKETSENFELEIPRVPRFQTLFFLKWRPSYFFLQTLLTNKQTNKQRGKSFKNTKSKKMAKAKAALVTQGWKWSHCKPTQLDELVPALGQLASHLNTCFSDVF